MIRKKMRVRENSFKQLNDPFPNAESAKYIFYVKIDDVPDGVPMATNPR